MQNENREFVNTYVPRKCFATNRILDSKDKASVQIEFSTVSIFINIRKICQIKKIQNYH